MFDRDPTHLDSHQHVHRFEPCRSVIADVGARPGIPVRDAGPVRYCGGFYGQSGKGDHLPELISVDALLGLLDEVGEG